MDGVDPDSRGRVLGTALGFLARRGRARNNRRVPRKAGQGPRRRRRRPRRPPRTPCPSMSLLEMDLEDLARVRVSGGSSRARETELTAPSSAIDVSDSTLDARHDHGATGHAVAGRERPQALRHQSGSARARLPLRAAERQRRRHDAAENHPGFGFPVQPDRSGDRAGTDGDRRSLQLAVRSGVRVPGGPAGRSAAVSRRARSPRLRPRSPTAATARRSRPARTSWAGPRTGACCSATGSARATTICPGAATDSGSRRAIRNGTGC